MALVSTMRVTCLGLALAAVAEANFMPFAGVEELKPQRLEQFCEKGFLPSEDGLGRLRRCSHTVKKKLDDGGDVELGWKMTADPDSILSLDTEAEHGVRLSKCSPRELEVELPASYLHHAAVGKIIVGSSFVHGCAHLQGQNFLHRINEIGHRYLVEGRAMHRVQLGAEPLHSIAHAVPSLNFHFSYMPVEATDFSEYPEMVTDWGENRPYLKQNKGRKLSISDTLSNGIANMKDSFKNLDDVNGVEEDDGGFAADGQTKTNFDTKNSFLNLQPKQLSNFGWNWNFYMNTTQADYSKELPGLAGWMQLHDPYIRVHAGIYLNFSSEFTGLTAAPEVRWTAGIKGHGNVNARVEASLNTTDDTGVDPFHVFKLPVLEHLEKPKWFNEVEFATGALPIKMEPGVQFQASMYHKGQFKGRASFGGKTHGTINPSLTYNSLEGFETKFEGELLDTEVIPPLWLIFTQQFEIGVLGMPAILMRGDFAGMEKATMAIEGRPYMNVTVVRGGNNAAAAVAGAAAGTAGGVVTKTLTAYPYRVSGIHDVDFHTKYKVNITANGQTLGSSSEINWGHVEYRDHVGSFDFGKIDEKSLMEQTFTVTLIKVNDASGVASETIMGTGAVVCTSLLNGECEPSPSTATIMSSSGATVASVDLTIVWEDSPETKFASKIRGLGMSFPDVILRQDILEQSFPSIAAPADASASSFKLHLVYAGKIYVTSLNGTIDTSSSTLRGDDIIDFGPTILQNWLPCEAPCESPRLELYFGGTQVGAADLPQFDFSSQTAMQGTGSGFMGTSSSKEMDVPASVTLYAPGSTTATVAVVKINMKVVMPMSSSIFLMPKMATQVQWGGQQTFGWTVSGADDTQKEYDFSLTAYKLATVDTAEMQNYVSSDHVDDKVLVPVDGSTKELTQACMFRETAGLPASQAPCSFLTTLDITEDKFSVGDQIVVTISRSDTDGKKHLMSSPPMEIVTSSTYARRLSTEAPERRLWSAADWDARVQSHGQTCHERNLHFLLGAGMLVRGKVEQVEVPDGMPMIGGMMENPKIATKWKPVEKLPPGTDLIDLIGGNNSLVCQTGLCAGALPGCRQTGAPVMTFPKLVFDFNRPYHYGKNGSAAFGGMFKTALAYAFSTLPEAVDIMIKEEKEHAAAMQAHPTQAPEDTYNAPWNSVQHTAPAEPAQTMATTPAPHEKVFDAMKQWWGGNSGLDRRRRLSSADLPQGVGSSEELPKALESHQIAVHFKQGLPFVVDRKLVEMMHTSGQLKMHLERVKDDDYKQHGALDITNFYVDSGVPEGWAKPCDGDVHPWAAGAKPQTPAARGLPVVQGLGLAAFGGCCALLVAMFMTKRSPRGARYTPTYEISEEPLDAMPDALE